MSPRGAGRFCGRGETPRARTFSEDRDPLSDLGFAAGAVLPVFAIIALGVAVRLGGILDDEAVGRLSRLAFVVAMPALVFQVISKADLAQVWSGRAVLGIAWRLVAEKVEWWKMPAVVDLPLSWLSRMCLPLALLAVGASLRPGALKSGLGRVLLAAGFKLIVEPAAALVILRQLRVADAYLAAVVVCLSAPTAIATYTMVRAMKGDDELAAQMVTGSTALSVLTMAGWLLVLKQMGVAPPL